jgi:hypothetical protein
MGRAEWVKRRRMQVSEEAYASTIEVENVNRQEGVVEARSVDAALEVLSLAGSDAAADRHPEKCVWVLLLWVRRAKVIT